MTNSLHRRAEVLQDRFGFTVASRLSAGSSDLPHDISERLRASRVQALARRKIAGVQMAAAVNLNGSHSATLGSGDEGFGIWGRLATLFPLIALVVGMVAINVLQNDSRAREVAEVDAALLTDDLPPNAYADPGFIQFLKSGQEAPR
jgi:hypothetical protein